MAALMVTRIKYRFRFCTLLLKRLIHEGGHAYKLRSAIAVNWIQGVQ
jgi:hypothetical protein